MTARKIPTEIIDVEQHEKLELMGRYDIENLTSLKLMKNGALSSFDLSKLQSHIRNQFDSNHKTRNVVVVLYLKSSRKAKTP